MPSSNDSNEKSTPSSEIVSFKFPQDDLLSLYALAAVQGFAVHYLPAYERANIWRQHPDAVRRLQIDIYSCTPKFYGMFRKHFPACVRYIPEGSCGDVDEMTVDYSEASLGMFTTTPGYSTQWLMGTLAGTMTKMLPSLSETVYSKRVVVDTRYWPQVHEYVDGIQLALNLPDSSLTDVVNTAQLTLAETYALAKYAAVIIAPESKLTVLGLALQKRVVEVTKTASQRPFGAMQTYVQVSRLMPETYFDAALKRGIQWVCREITIHSAAPTVDAKSEQSPPVSE